MEVVHSRDGEEERNARAVTGDVELKEEVEGAMEECDVKEVVDTRIFDVRVACASQWLRSGSMPRREMPLYVYPLTRSDACLQNTRQVIQCPTSSQSRSVNLQMKFGMEADFKNQTYFGNWKYTWIHNFGIFTRPF